MDFVSFLASPESSPADFRDGDMTLPLGDRRDGLFYYYGPEVKLAIRIALAVGRPLLLLGPSGCGKSSIVFNLARLMGRRYYEFVVQARTEAQELFYRFDAVRRLGEAQASAAARSQGARDWRSFYPFIEPGPLWWVFDPESASRRGATGAEGGAFDPPVDPGRWPASYSDPAARDRLPRVNTTPAVLLIDEIDKADPDFPNNLLIPLGSQRFAIEETGDIVTLGSGGVESDMPLIVITSNRERELPDAFVRRCVVLQLQAPTPESLVFLAQKAFRRSEPSDVQRFTAIAEKLVEVRGADRLSTAEFLDVVRAIESLGAEESTWEDIILHTTWTVSDDVG